MSSIQLFGGSSFGETSLLKTIDVDPLACCWITVPVTEAECTHYRLEFRGPEATLRVRQLKLFGYSVEDKAAQLKQNIKSTSANYIQQKNCEAETLRVFRLLTGQVRDKLPHAFICIARLFCCSTGFRKIDPRKRQKLRL